MANVAQARLADALTALESAKAEAAARESELLARIKAQVEAHRELELESAKLGADLTRMAHDADRNLQRALEAEDRYARRIFAPHAEPIPSAGAA